MLGGELKETILARTLQSSKIMVKGQHIDRITASF